MSDEGSQDAKQERLAQRDQFLRYLRSQFGTDSAPEIWAREYGGAAFAEPVNEAETALMEFMIVTFEWMKVEGKQSPKTFYHYQPGKEFRYCEPKRWGEVEASAKQAFDYEFNEELGLAAFETAKTSDGRTKALALAAAKWGVEIEQHFPGLLEQSVCQGLFRFLEHLHKAKKDASQPLKGWRLMVAAKWASQSLPEVNGGWPFCFWTDEAIVQFFSQFGADVTLDKWRKFRRASGLKRPSHTIVAGFEEVFGGSSADGIERECEGLRIRISVRKVPDSDR